MVRSKIKLLVVIAFATNINVAYSGDDYQMSYYWMSDFFSKGIQSAHAEYTLNLEKPQTATPNYFCQSVYTIDFDYESKKYVYRFLFEYVDLWSALTNFDSIPPPHQEVHFVGSKITPWRNVDGFGKYQETYEHVQPNWYFFDHLDSLLIDQAIFRNPLPPLSGIFYSDEFKVLKKMHKSCNMEEVYDDKIWACFEFDNEGNVVELSCRYLYSLNSQNLLESKKIKEYKITITNNDNQVVMIEILSAKAAPQIIEGIVVRWGDLKAKIYNFEINEVIHKFAPDLLVDPNELIIDYLKKLQEESERELTRFETISAKT